MTCDSCPTNSTGPLTPAPDAAGTATPSALVAACAPLLGFQPQECLVGFVGGVPGRSAPVLIRLDLGSAGEAMSRAAAVTRAVLGTGGDRVSVVAWVSADPSVPASTLPSSPLLGHLGRQLRAGGVAVHRLISTNGAVWWSHSCAGSGCPTHAQPLDEQFLARAKAEYVFAGYAPLSSRGALAERIAHDETRCAAVREAWAGPDLPSISTQWREQEIDYLSLLLLPGARAGVGPAVGPSAGLAAGPSAAPEPDQAVGGCSLTPGQVVRVLRGLTDIVVRDVVVHRLAGAEPAPPRPWAETETVLCDVVRSSPPGLGAPPATLLALVAWLGGDGALANLALDRAWADDPEYRLANLTRRLVESGADPRSWRSVIRSMPEQQCWATS